MTYQKATHYLAYVALAIPALPPALFPFFQPYTFGKTTLFEILVEGMTLLWFAGRFHPFTTSDVVNERQPVWHAMLALALVLSASTMLSANVVASFWGSSARMDGLFTLLHFFAFFILLASSLREYAWHRCILISVGAGTFSALYAIAQWFDAPFVVASEGEIFGTLGNPSYLALYLLFTIFLAHYLAEKEEKREAALILYCAVALQVIALLLTQVQAGILALAAGTAVALYPYLRARITTLARGILSLTAVGALILLFSLSANFTKLVSLSEGGVSLSNRIAVWNIALSGIAEKPFFGHGANMFEPYYLAQKNEGIVPLPATGEAFDKPHNAYLEIAFSYGIIGLVAYLFFLLVIVRRAWHTPALAGACIGYFVFLFFFFDTFASYLMFFFVAAFLTHDRNEPSYLETRLPPTWKPSFQVGAVVLILLFFVFHYQPLYSAYSARQFLLRASATRAFNETARVQALRYHSFNAPFIERAIFLAERAMKK